MNDAKQNKRAKIWAESGWDGGARVRYAKPEFTYRTIAPPPIFARVPEDEPLAGYISDGKTTEASEGARE